MKLGYVTAETEIRLKQDAQEWIRNKDEQKDPYQQQRFESFMRDMDTTKRKLQNEIQKAQDENLKPTEEYRLAEAK